VVYFYWPETARLSLEEIAKNFGDEVAVHIHDATEEEKIKLDQQLAKSDVMGGAGTSPEVTPKHV
jgi:(p)ppGpp synthase/HD superfamily hydrolase